MIELLSAVAVILILFAIIFSVYPAVREISERSVCASNLRQIGAMTQLFSADNDGKVLLAEMRPGKVTFNQEYLWPQQLAKYVGDPFEHIKKPDGKYDYTRNTLRELMCPTLMRVNPPVAWNPSYAMFGSTADPAQVEGASYIYVGMIPNPSDKVYIGDSPFKSGGTADEYWKGVASRPISYNDLDIKDARGIIFRHRGRANLLYHDGHVESHTPDELPLPPKAAPGSHEYRSTFDWLY